MKCRELAIVLVILLCVVLVHFNGTTIWSTKIVFGSQSSNDTTRVVSSAAPAKGTPTGRYALQFEDMPDTFEAMRQNALMDKKAVYLSLQTPPPFDPAFKNPCWWYGKNNSSLACLPYFYLAGFPKSGTTDLYTRLTNHPLICRGRRKEPHYLTRMYFHGTETRAGSNPYDRTSSDIISYAKMFFDKATSQIRSQRLDKIDASLYAGNEAKSKEIYRYPSITVDASASTAWDNSNGHHIIRDIALPDEVTRHSASIADWIVRMNPDVRVLLIVREPVSRAYSDYNYFRKETSARQFDNLVNSFLKEYHRCMAWGNSSTVVCAWAAKKVAKIRLQVGLYHLYIEEWLARLPRDRIHVMRTEDYHTNMTQSLQQVFEFLGLPSLSGSMLNKVLNLRSQNVHGGYKSSKPMLQKTREKLFKFYQPFNERLAKVLNNNAFLWQDI